jgi:hypothetical protein
MSRPVAPSPRRRRPFLFRAVRPTLASAPPRLSGTINACLERIDIIDASTSFLRRHHGTHSASSSLRSVADS